MKDEISIEKQVTLIKDKLTGLQNNDSEEFQMTVKHKGSEGHILHEASEINLRSSADRHSLKFVGSATER